MTRTLPPFRRRRALLAAALALPAHAPAAPASAQPAPDPAPRPAPPGSAGPRASAEPTPACGSQTRAQTPGPFFLDGAPERATLRGPGLPGPALLLAGRVTDRACRPISGARVDLWHADDAGDYDLRGFRARGAQRTDQDGRFAFETIRPGLYPGRTRHFHLRIAVAGGPVLVTQAYFPDEPGNARDPLFRDSLVMAVTRVGPDLACRFDPVLATG